MDHFKNTVLHNLLDSEIAIVRSVLSRIYGTLSTTRNFTTKNHSWTL